jgi:MFS family permease
MKPVYCKQPMLMKQVLDGIQENLSQDKFIIGMANLSTLLHNQTSQLRTFNRSARLFLLSVIMDGIVISAWQLFFNFYILERGFERDFLGMVNAMPAVAALALGIPMGLLSDKIGRKRAMVLGIAVFIVAMALEVTLYDPVLILIAAFVAGGAQMLYYLSQAPFMMKVSDEHNRTLLFSLSFGLVTLSGAVGSVFAGQLPALFGSWLEVPARSATAYQAVLLCSVGLGLFTLVPLLLIREPPRTGAAQQARQNTSIWQVLKRPLTLQLSLPNLLIGFGAAILIPYMNVFLSERHAVSDQRLGLLFSISSLMVGFGSIIGPRVAGILGGKIRAVVLTQALSLIFLLVMGFSPVFWLVAIGFLMRGTLMNMAVPLFSAFSMEQVVESEQGTVNSVKELAWQMGWAVGPYVSGLVQVSYGFTPLFITTASLYASAIVFTWILFGKREPRLSLSKDSGQEEIPSGLADLTGD